MEETQENLSDLENYLNDVKKRNLQKTEDFLNTLT